MGKKNVAEVYLMTGDSYEPFSIVYALLRPATDSHLMHRQEIAFVWDNGVLVQVSPPQQTNE